METLEIQFKKEWNLSARRNAIMKAVTDIKGCKLIKIYLKKGPEKVIWEGIQLQEHLLKTAESFVIEYQLTNKNKTQMKIYVASSWRNEFQPAVVASLQAMGHEVYDFREPGSGRNGFSWSEIDPNWEKWGPNEYVQNLKHPRAEQGFKADFDAMKWADVCLMVLPCGRSANTEAGWMKGAGKKVYVFQPLKQEPELMYKLYDGIITNGDELHQVFGRELKYLDLKSSVKTGIELISAERKEQIEKHGRTIEKDVMENNHYQLSEGAGLLTYVDPEDVSGIPLDNNQYDFSGCCPVQWNPEIWHKMMNKPYIERMAIAGALLGAEIDRLIEIGKMNTVVEN